MLSFNLLRRLSLLSDFKIKKHCFKSFYGYALMNKVQLLNRTFTNEVQLLENSSSGRNYLLPLILSLSEVLSSPFIEEILSLDFHLKSD